MTKFERDKKTDWTTRYDDEASTDEHDLPSTTHWRQFIHSYAHQFSISNSTKWNRADAATPRFQEISICLPQQQCLTMEIQNSTPFTTDEYPLLKNYDYIGAINHDSWSNQLYIIMWYIRSTIIFTTFVHWILVDFFSQA